MNLSQRTHERAHEGKTDVVIESFHDSLNVLAEVCMREARALGYVFLRFEEIVLSGGISDIAGLFQLKYSLDDGGILLFVFESDAESKAANLRIAPLVESIQAVWAASHKAEAYVTLAGKVADLESRLMDTKIAERARGFLSDVNRSIPIDVIARHVEGILRPTQTRQLLEETSRELVEEFEERQAVSRAKSILQSTHGMSEEEAHGYLRTTSRKSRVRLKQVAERVIETYKETRLVRSSSSQQ